MHTAGTKLKARDGWNSYSGVPSGTDEYGFSALPSGGGGSDGIFDDVGTRGAWWSSTEFWDSPFGNDSNYANVRSMSYIIEFVSWASPGKDDLFSVRCLQD